MPLKESAIWPISSLEFTGTMARTSPMASDRAACATSFTVLRTPRMITKPITVTAPTTPINAASTMNNLILASRELAAVASSINSSEWSSTIFSLSRACNESSHHCCAAIVLASTARRSFTVPMMDRMKFTSGPWNTLR